MKKQIVMIIACGVALAACGGSGSDPTPSTTTLTLTGQVVVTQADFDLAVPVSRKATGKRAPISFDTVATTPAADFDITLYKIKADGSEELVSGNTATTDANGNYMLEEVEVPTTGTGAATDFYYEVRATNANSEFELRAPAAPATPPRSASGSSSTPRSRRSSMPNAPGLMTRRSNSS